MKEDELNLKLKKAISWVIFLIVALWVGFFAYHFFYNKMIDYRMEVCLNDFYEDYLAYGTIYEYDSSCKNIFLDEENLEFCKTLDNPDFCYYSFANFASESSRDFICQKISDSSLCSNFYLD